MNKKNKLLSGRLLTKALDEVVRQILHKKYPHPTCFVCGKKIDWFHPRNNPYGMQVGHYISRSVYYLRWDFKNLETQCSQCNYKHENNTLPFTDKIIEHYGLERFNYLMKIYKMYHNSGIKLTTGNKRELLQKLLIDLDQTK